MPKPKASLKQVNSIVYPDWNKLTKMIDEIQTNCNLNNINVI